MDSRGAPKLKDKGKEYDIDFTKPGERLGLFHRPEPDTKVMPRSKHTLAEVSVKQNDFNSSPSYPVFFNNMYTVCNIEKLEIGLGNEAVFSNVNISEYSILAENMLLLTQ